MAKPTPKSNFLQTALLMIVIFLGMQLLFSSQKTASVEFGGQKLDTPAKVLTAMRDADAKVLDQTMAHTLYPALTRTVNEEVKAGRLTQPQGEEILREGAVLLADAQYRAGVHWNETGRFRAAHQTLVALENRLLNSPEWQKEYDLPRIKEYEYNRISGHELYRKTVATLSARNKTELIWGFIPGGYQLIDFLVHATGAKPGFSYAFAAFLLALVVRAIVFPLTQKQLMFGRQMSQLGPLTNEIKKKFEDDKTEQQKRIMELYREYGINPMAGCGPMFLQMPLFLTIYQCMLLYEFEFHNGTFAWINPVTSRGTHGLIAPNLGQLDYILIVLYGISMLVSTLLMPVSDPTQIKQQRLMGVGMSLMVTVFMFIGAVPVPAAFVLYWTFTNILATAQSLRAYRLPAPPLVKVNAPGGGVYPTSGGSRWMQKLEQLQKQAAEQQNQASTGATNGRPKTDGPLSGPIVSPGDVKTGTPAKHKPKKRR